MAPIEKSKISTSPQVKWTCQKCLWNLQTSPRQLQLNNFTVSQVAPTEKGGIDTGHQVKSNMSASNLQTNYFRIITSGSLCGQTYNST